MTTYDQKRRPHVYAAALRQYDAVEASIKEDLEEALSWARQMLTNHEGTGHDFQLATRGDMFVFCFAKPSWPADHASQPMPTAQEAIVMGVCEYLNGV